MNERIERMMKNPRRGLITLAWPVMVSMLFGTLLNFTDFFFVGGLGPEAMASVQIAFPMFFLMIAFSSGIGVGTASLIARRLGERNVKWAEETGLHALLLAAVVSAVFVASGLLVILPASGMLGGSATVNKLTAEYLGYIFAGSTVFFLVASMQSILQGEGNTKTAMKFSLVFTISNMVLDPIFIYSLGIGVGGAALATVVSEAIAFALLFWYVIGAKRSFLKIRLGEFEFMPRIITNIFKVGLPAAFAQISLSIAVVGVNLLLSGFGDLAISAYGIGFRVDSLAILPVLGLGAGMIPLVGYHRGAKDFAGAKKVSRFAAKLALVFTAAIGAVMFVFADFVPKLFTSDQTTITLAAHYLRVIAFAYPFIGLTITMSATFQGLGRGMPSLIITLSRAVLLVLPTCYYLGYVAGFGVFGILLGIAISSAVSATLAFLWLERQFEKLCGAC